MDEMLVVTFKDERQAYDGIKALKDLHADGSVTLYGYSVITKEAGGVVKTKDQATQGPLGTTVGLMTGSLVGLMGGALGVAAGAAAGVAAAAAASGAMVGGFGGYLYDLTSLGVGLDYLDQVAAQMEPGTVSVVAEVDENWVTPVDTRMEALGGTVLRRPIGEVVDAQYERDTAALKADIKRLQAEQQQAHGESKAKLQAKIDAANANLKETQRRASERREAKHQEFKAKLEHLKEQAHHAHPANRKSLDERQAQVEKNYKEYTAKVDHPIEPVHEVTVA